MAQFKCKYCKEKDDADNLVLEEIEGRRKKDHRDGKWKKGDTFYQKVRFHQSCRDRTLRETKEWEICYETVKEIHGLTTIPDFFVIMLQRVRNGNTTIGMKNSEGKRYKEGYEYPIITECYERKRDLIQWKMKQWDGGDLQFMQFVMKYYIDDIINQVAREYEIKKEKEKKMKQVNEDFDFELSKPSKERKKTDDDMDISNFL